MMMFDANMRGVPRSELFITETLSVPEGSKAYAYGAREGQVYLASVCGEDFEGNTIVRLYLNNTWVRLIEHTDENFDDQPLFIYAGGVDGQGYIDHEVQEEAYKLLKSCSLSLLWDMTDA